MKEYVDLAIIIPLGEEFDVVVKYFDFVKDISTAKQIRFLVKPRSSELNVVLAKQHFMGRTECIHATLDVLEGFDVGMLVCLGIAGGLSSDVSIGDVCYTGSVIDLLDNAKVTDHLQPIRERPKRHKGPTPPKAAGQQVAFSPTYYETPIEIAIALNLDRVLPDSKTGHEDWATEQGALGKSEIPHKFMGKSGNLETIEPPVVREGLIACASVSGSKEYNTKIKALDRRVLAIETESGGLFSIAKREVIPALTVRGISDYAGFGIDKNKFEQQTKGRARFIAASNAASYLSRQLNSPRIVQFLHNRRKSTALVTNTLTRSPAEMLADMLLLQAGVFDDRLRDLAPEYSLQSKGYRIPVPRIRFMDSRLDLAAADQAPVEVRDALQKSRLLVLQVPPQYPDRSLSWIIARDLLSAQMEGKQVLPCVIEAREFRRPDRGVRELTDDRIISMSADLQVIFLIDEFNFDSVTQARFLSDQVDAVQGPKFVIVTRNKANILAESEFVRRTGASVGYLTDISFLEISHFLQKNYEMAAPAAEVVAVRLRETFQRFKLSAHPSYFAGIPATTVTSLLRANRRAELIELAVAGYLSYVVSLDDEPISLSRKTREMFLTSLAHDMKVNRRSFSEVELTASASDFAKRFDFSISPTRFIASFIARGILTIEQDGVRFTLPFMESYLLAKRLHEEPEIAIQYFEFSDQGFDLAAFIIWAELGVSDLFVQKAD